MTQIDRVGDSIVNASVQALATELSIVISAADRIAGGHGLSWADYDRLHIAHQHIITILGAVTAKGGGR